MTNNDPLWPELTPQQRHCLQLLAAAFLETDDDRAAELIRQSGEALISSVRQTWGEKLRAAEILHDKAERALNSAERSTDAAGRDRWLTMFELYLRASRESAGLPPL